MASAMTTATASSTAPPTALATELETQITPNTILYSNIVANIAAEYIKGLILLYYSYLSLYSARLGNHNIIQDILPHKITVNNLYTKIHTYNVLQHTLNTIIRNLLYNIIITNNGKIYGNSVMEYIKNKHAETTHTIKTIDIINTTNTAIDIIITYENFKYLFKQYISMFYKTFIITDSKLTNISDTHKNVDIKHDAYLKSYTLILSQIYTREQIILNIIIDMSNDNNNINIPYGVCEIKEQFIIYDGTYFALSNCFTYDVDDNHNTALQIIINNIINNSITIMPYTINYNMCVEFITTMNKYLSIPKIVCAFLTPTSKIDGHFYLTNYDTCCTCVRCNEIITDKEYCINKCCLSALHIKCMYNCYINDYNMYSDRHTYCKCVKCNIVSLDTNGHNSSILMGLLNIQS